MLKTILIKRILIIALCLILLASILLFATNAHVKGVSKPYLISVQDAAKLLDVDCILVLGCGVRDDGTPSNMLQDRLSRGIELYRCEASPKLLMSGDHGQADYDEVNTMKRIAVDHGVPSQDVFMDHAGFSTYESLYRAKEIFKADKIIIVSQEYHLYRALYIAKQLGIEAYGVSSDQHTYGGQFARDVREVFARCKDAVTSIFKPKPTYLGEAIPVSGNGNVTNDR